MTMTSGSIDCGNGVRLERGVRCPVSDGVELVSDHYYPPSGGTHPTLLMRQPYGRDIARTARKPLPGCAHGRNQMAESACMVFPIKE